MKKIIAIAAISTAALLMTACGNEAKAGWFDNLFGGNATDAAAQSNATGEGEGKFSVEVEANGRTAGNVGGNGGGSASGDDAKDNARGNGYGNTDGAASGQGGGKLSMSFEGRAKADADMKAGGASQNTASGAAQ